MWWKNIPNKGIEFLDSNKEAFSHPDRPQLHHFRSSNMTEEINKCWKICIERDIQLPLLTVRRYSDEGYLQALDRFGPASTPRAEAQMESIYEPMEVQDDLEGLECESNSTEQTN